MSIFQIDKSSHLHIKFRPTYFLQQGSPVRKLALPLLLGAVSYPLWYRVFNARIPPQIPPGQSLSPLRPMIGAMTVALCSHCVLRKLPKIRIVFRRAPTNVPASPQKPQATQPSALINNAHHKKAGSYLGKVELPKASLLSVVNSISEELEKNRVAIENNADLNWWFFTMQEYIVKLHQHIRSEFEERTQDNVRLRHLEECSLRLAKTTLDLTNAFLSMIKAPSSVNSEALKIFGSLRIHCILIQADISFEYEVPTFSDAKIIPLELIDPSGTTMVYEVIILNKESVLLSLNDVLGKGEQELRKQLGIATNRLV
jgi:hypothetical protein